MLKDKVLRLKDTEDTLTALQEKFTLKQEESATHLCRLLADALQKEEKVKLCEEKLLETEKRLKETERIKEEQENKITNMKDRVCVCITNMKDRGKLMDYYFCKRGVSELLKACNDGRVDLVEILLELGVDINSIDGDTHTPLYRACVSGHINVVKFLLDRGANIELPLAKVHMNTPLIGACYHGLLEVVKLLVDNGADIHYKNIVCLR
eukprot:GHVR01057574.1.p1 GENE.GHVR01057574.1~~GHVR01057574.1.p1  ORF type:complete len:209 (+),score=43.86 GHVR01057574.1:165-791(+)